MTDLEERLRDDLRDAAEAMPAELDVDAVLHHGRRRRAARAQRRGFAAMAAVTVVGLVAWLGLTPRGTAGVPDPAASPTTPPVVSSITVEPETLNGAPPQYRSITIGESGNSLIVTAAKQKSDPPTTLASVPFDPAVAAGTPITRRLYLWVIPGRVDWVDTVTARTANATYLPHHDYLSSAGVTIALVISDRDQPVAKWIDGVIWQADDGTLHSSAGTPVSSASLQFSDRSLIVYRDPGLKQISFFDPMQGQGFTSARDDSPPTDVLKIQIATSGSTHGWEQFAVGILPPGARDPRVTTSVTGTEVVTGTMQPDGTQAFVALHHATAEPKGRFVTKVTYTDAQSRTRTYRP